MRIYSVFGLALTLFAADASAYVGMPCPDISTEEQFQGSNSVVAATAIGISLRAVEDRTYLRRTILWRVGYNWRGLNYQGKTFTTRDYLDCENCNWPISKGTSMLLYLSGHEPYEEPERCSRSGLLENSVEEVHRLFQLKESWAVPPNNSFKPRPLRGSA